MGLFNETIKDLEAYIQKKEDKGKIRIIKHDDYEDWPSSNTPNIILKEDIGVELGNPEMASDSFMVWTEDLESLEKIRSGMITLVGPDLVESWGKSLPFAQILVLKGHFEDEYECYRRLINIERDIDLDGYMFRAVPQRRRIWSRVSKEALEKGFSLGNIGKTLIDKFKKEDSVDAVGVIFVTSTTKDVKELEDISNRVQRIVGAMNKMVEEMSFDCNSCEYLDVCGEVRDLRKIRRKLQETEVRVTRNG